MLSLAISASSGLGRSGTSCWISSSDRLFEIDSAASKKVGTRISISAMPVIWLAEVA